MMNSQKTQKNNELIALVEKRLLLQVDILSRKANILRQLQNIPDDQWNEDWEKALRQLGVG